MLYSFKRILVSFYNVHGASRAARLQPSYDYASVVQIHLMKGTCEIYVAGSGDDWATEHDFLTYRNKSTKNCFVFFSNPK